MQFDKCISIVDVDGTFFKGEKVLSSFRVLEYACIAKVNFSDLPQFIVKNVVNLNLIDERSCKLIARWMHSNCDERFCHWSVVAVFQHIVLSCKLTLARNIVPESYS